LAVDPDWSETVGWRNKAHQWAAPICKVQKKGEKLV